MAEFEYLDEAALTDDNPWSSALFRKVRNSVGHIKEERNQRTAYIFNDGFSPKRLSSFAPSVYQLGEIWQADPRSQVTVRIHLDAVEFDGEAAGAEAVDMHITLGVPSDETIQPPPDSNEEWEHTALKGTDDDTTKTFTQIDNRSDVRGPLIVYLWIKSRTGDVEDSGSGLQSRALGQRVVPGVTASLSSTPERVLFSGYDPAGKGIPLNEAGVEAAQMAHWDANNEMAWVIPFRGGWTAGAGVIPVDWEIHYQGVVVIGSFSIELDGGPTLPPFRLYRSRRPCSWAPHQNLVGALTSMVRNRVPTLRPRMALEAGNFWLVAGRAGDIPPLTNTNGDVTDYVTIAQAVGGQYVPNADGLVCLVSFIPYDSRDNPNTTSHVLHFRLRYLDWATGAVNEESIESSLTVSPQLLNEGDGATSHVLQQLLQTKFLTTYKYRGQLNGLASQQAIHRHVLDIRKTALAWPWEVELQVRNASATNVTRKLEVAFINVSFFWRPKDIDASGF